MSWPHAALSLRKEGKSSPLGPPPEFPMCRSGWVPRLSATGSRGRLLTDCTGRAAGMSHDVLCAVGAPGDAGCSGRAGTGACDGSSRGPWGSRAARLLLSPGPRFCPQRPPRCRPALCPAPAPLAVSLVLGSPQEAPPGSARPRPPAPKAQAARPHQDGPGPFALTGQPAALPVSHLVWACAHALASAGCAPSGRAAPLRPPLRRPAVLLSGSCGCPGRRDSGRLSGCRAGWGCPRKCACLLRKQGTGSEVGGPRQGRHGGVLSSLPDWK